MTLNMVVCIGSGVFHLRIFFCRQYFFWHPDWRWNVFAPRHSTLKGSERPSRASQGTESCLLRPFPSAEDFVLVILAVQEQVLEYMATSSVTRHVAQGPRAMRLRPVLHAIPTPRSGLTGLALAARHTCDSTLGKRWLRNALRSISAACRGM